VIFVLNFRVPLTRVTSARHLMLEYGTDLDQLMKLGKPKPPRTNDSIALLKYLDVNIFCTIVITICVCYRPEFKTKTYIFGSSSILFVILIESLDIVHCLRLHIIYIYHIIIYLFTFRRSLRIWNASHSLHKYARHLS
jgi:hypothetical protein